MMLEGMRILDLTHRLPGPLAGKILADLGAEVIKLEDEVHKDPFLSGMFSQFDQSFEDWYEQLNQNKKVLRWNFKAPEIKDKVLELLKSVDAVMLSLSPKLKSNLGLDEATLKDLGKPMAIVELEASSTQNKAMHDLNALAISGYLSLHVARETDDVIPPPFLPVAGIAFGQQVATEILANYIKALKTGGTVSSKCYLHDSAASIFQPFWSQNLRQQKKTQFLHNGAYPCYSLYRTKDDHYVAVAAVEEKFWSELIALFNIPLPLEKRFETDSAAFQKVAGAFAKLTTVEIETLIKDKELCLSIVRKIN